MAPQRGGSTCFVLNVSLSFGCRLIEKRIAAGETRSPCVSTQGICLVMRLPNLFIVILGFLGISLSGGACLREVSCDLAHRR
jgi:hypothetical protein